MATQWFPKTKISDKAPTNIGLVDEKDPVKRKFYLTKMLGQLKAKYPDLTVTTVESEDPMRKIPLIHIFVQAPKQPELKKFKFLAWIHPRGGGDDYEIEGTTKAENEDEAKKQIEKYLKRKGSHVTNDYCLVG